jgi:hopanoid biosynthesis associated RND transporter like protein HpnN
MVVALLFSLTLLPALVLLLKPGSPRGDVGFAQLAPADRFLERRRGAVLWAFALAMAASIATLPWVAFDFNPLHLRDPEAPAMRALGDLTRDPDRTPNTIDVLARNADEARQLTQKLAKLPEVARVISVDSFVPEDQAPKLALVQDASTLLDLTLNPFDITPPPGDAEMQAAVSATAQRLQTVAAKHPGAEGADARALATAFDRLAKATPAQREQVNAMLSQPLGVMLDQMRLALQAAPVDRASLPAEIARLDRTRWPRACEVFPSGNANDNRVIHRFRDAVAAVTPAISGLPVATQAAASTVAGAFVQAGVIAFLLVSVLLFLVLRDAKEVAFTLAPVVLSIFLTLGSCVVIGQPINFANIIAFPLLFGVGVAFHIYFVMAWRDGATGLLQSSLARAVLFSAFATGTAFGSLWLSHHPGTASMGKILMISLIWTLICALVFEPALLGPPRAKAQPRAKRSAVKAAARASLPDRPADRATRARRTEAPAVRAVCRSVPDRSADRSVPARPAGERSRHAPWLPRPRPRDSGDRPNAGWHRDRPRHRTGRANPRRFGAQVQPANAAGDELVFHRIERLARDQRQKRVVGRIAQQVAQRWGPMNGRKMYGPGPTP